MKPSSTSPWMRLRGRLAHWSLVPAVALTHLPAWANLPAMPTPGTDMQGNTVADGNWLGAMSAWFKAGIAVLGLVLGGLAFLYVVGGALAKWRMYSRGQAEIADLKEYFIMGAILAVFVIVMITYAFQVIGNT